MVSQRSRGVEHLRGLSSLPTSSRVSQVARAQAINASLERADRRGPIGRQTRDEANEMRALRQKSIRPPTSDCTMTSMARSRALLPQSTASRSPGTGSKPQRAVSPMTCSPDGIVRVSTFPPGATDGTLHSTSASSGAETPTNRLLSAHLSHAAYHAARGPCVPFFISLDASSGVIIPRCLWPASPSPAQ